MTPHAQVLQLRRAHSLRQVAQMTGLPLGTVKTICSRSGAFRDNGRHRALFTLPEPRPSGCTALARPELPAQEAVTGHKELDALLWLRRVIASGHPDHIERAMQAAECIKTPRKELAQLYTEFLRRAHPGNLFPTFESIGLEDLQGLARRSVETARDRADALARFDNEQDLFDATPAERFCIEVLEGAKPDRHVILDDGDVAERMKARPELLPHTLADCLHELGYWSRLYRLRRAVERDAADSPPEAYAREQFVLAQMAHIRPRSRDEAAEVLRYLASDADRMNDAETPGILRNLIG